jgi:CheY-like chemotaxis protein
MNIAEVNFLVVDDQVFIRNLVQSMLSRLGARNIAMAVSGADALRVLELRGSQISCIISDWSMGPTNGLELLRAVRTGGAGVRSGLPFIMLTGYADSKVVTSAANLDVSAYLVKPVAAIKLLEAIKFVFSKPLIPKPASFYRRIELVDPPAEGAPPAVTRWAEWVKAGRPVFESEAASYIRRQSVELSAAPQSAAAQIRMVRYRRVDRIRAGDILVEDFCDDDGTVLLAAGLVLNQKVLSKLGEVKTAAGDLPRLWIGRL